MSGEMRENYTQLLDDLNDVFVEDIAIARGWLNDEKQADVNFTQSIINEGPYWQPEAAKDITGAVNLPLFLLEGVGIIALVVCILAVVL